MSRPSDDLRQAIQQLLDSYGDGWLLGEFVLALGLQRVDSDGSLESTAWTYAPPDQPEWMTDGLLEAAAEMRHSVIDN